MGMAPALKGGVSRLSLENWVWPFFGHVEFSTSIYIVTQCNENSIYSESDRKFYLPLTSYRLLFK